MADMRMLEELGRAKGEKMIEKTLEALKRNQDLWDKFNKVVEQLRKDKKKEKERIKHMIKPAPETKEAKLASIKKTASWLESQIQRVQA